MAHQTTDDTTTTCVCKYEGSCWYCKKRALHASYGAGRRNGCKNTRHVEDVQRHGGCSSCGRILSMAARRDANS